jgi:hypothetical protein
VREIDQDRSRRGAARYGVCCRCFPKTSRIGPEYHRDYEAVGFPSSSSAATSVRRGSEAVAEEITSTTFATRMCVQDVHWVIVDRRPAGHPLRSCIARETCRARFTLA